MQYFQLHPASVASTLLCVFLLRLHHGTRVHVYASTMVVVSALTSPVDHVACPPCLWLDPFKLCRFLCEYCVATTATHPSHGTSGAGRVYVTSRLEQQAQKLAAVEDVDKAQKHSTAAKPRADAGGVARQSQGGVGRRICHRWCGHVPERAHSAGPSCRLPMSACRFVRLPAHHC
jgi:hypothetical protein